MTPPTARDVHEAAARIAPHILRTPVLTNAMLDRLTGGRVFIKPEMLQRTGSFKLRGATNALRKHVELFGLPAGVVAYSSGNHGQAIACAAAALGVKAVIVMPADAPAIKREATAFWGAEIVEYDRATGNREAMAAEIAARMGAVVIPPYEHPDVIAGQGTLALELFADAGVKLDALLVCTGGGGLIAGCALAAKSVSPATRVYCVEPAGWDDTMRSLTAGVRLRNDMRGSKFCDAILTQIPGEMTFGINKQLLAGGFAVTDDEVRAAQVFSARHLKLVVEPGGAVALAAVLAGRFEAKGLALGVVVSGGNVDG
jgi:threonine dehydratase